MTLTPTPTAATPPEGWEARLAALWTSLPNQDDEPFRTALQRLVAELPDGADSGRIVLTGPSSATYPATGSSGSIHIGTDSLGAGVYRVRRADITEKLRRLKG